MTVLSIQERQHVWNTFETDRKCLYDQYQGVPFDPRTGLSPEALETEIERCLAASADQPRILQKANVCKLILARAQIHVDLCGWFPDKFNHAGLLQKLRARWHREAKAGELEEAAMWFKTLDALGMGRGSLDTGHISPGWENMFASGLLGLVEEAERHEAHCTTEEIERRDFYRAVQIVGKASIALSERFADQAERLARRYPAYRQRLLTVAAACRRVPAQSPQTLHEALTFAWLMHELIEFEGEAVRSLGRFDQMFFRQREKPTHQIRHIDIAGSELMCTNPNG